jgi:hypothetical protein
MAERFETLLAVMSGELSVSEGARRLGVSRNHFQTLLHRSQLGMLEGMTPKPAGRPATPPREAELETENERLRRENEKLQERVETIDRLLGVAGDLLKGRITPSGRPTRARSATKPAESSDDSDEEDPARRALEGARQMRALGLVPVLAAAVVGASPATLRRWNARVRDGRPPRDRRGCCQRRLLDSVTALKVDSVVRELHGLVGADALRHQVPGVSRREAAAIKSTAMTEMERERQARCGRIVVHQPGVIRGFDALYALTIDGPRWLLVSADAHVPYRTSIEVVPSYDGAAVAAAIARDFALHGPPLVWRIDRARCHEVLEVLKVLAAYEVLLLHGPPHHPRFYGQLERQNREHRAWLNAAGELDACALPALCGQMHRALNGAWSRRTLGWRTAETVWEARPVLDVDRSDLKKEVDHLTACIACNLIDRGGPADLAERLAIEQALINRGLLTLTEGARC